MSRVLDAALNHSLSSPLKKNHAFAVFALKALISVTLVWLVLSKVSLAEVRSTLAGADWTLLVLTIPLILLAMLLGAVRWRMLLLNQISLATAVRYTWIGLFFSTILPGAVSGDVAKGASLAYREPQTRGVDMAVSILMDRIIGLYALLILFCVSCGTMVLGITVSEPRLRTFAGAGFLISTVAVAFIAWIPSNKARATSHRILTELAPRRLKESVARWHQKFYQVTERRERLPTALVLSLAIHVTNTLAYDLAMRSLGVALAPTHVLVFYSVLSLLMVVPISVSGVGVRDWFSVLFFASSGLSTDLGVAFSWVWLGLTLVIAAGGGIIQLWELAAGRKSNSKPVQTPS